VTDSSDAFIASHLILKHVAKAVVETFGGVQAALDIHRFDPRIGILLLSSLDTLMDHYKLGFYE
jgi:hypothetical protein